MAQSSIDYGQAEIAAFNEAARAGTIRYDEGVVREAVRLYDQMIVGLQTIRGRLKRAQEATGFGGFQSSVELQTGFANKAANGIIVLDQLIAGVMRLQEAYLRAGNMLSEADQMSADALRFLAGEEAGTE
ncbi:hypothetical protein [Nocardia sp. NPDC005366]|uniref:hypothetical protein n=1 Tax=Nocardia sp. NPDC005366 TaxID=3156878 RepID=UPI00339F2494